MLACDLIDKQQAYKGEYLKFNHRHMILISKNPYNMKIILGLICYSIMPVQNNVSSELPYICLSLLLESVMAYK